MMFRTSTTFLFKSFSSLARSPLAKERPMLPVNYFSKAIAPFSMNRSVVPVIKIDSSKLQAATLSSDNDSSKITDSLGRVLKAHNIHEESYIKTRKELAAIFPNKHLVKYRGRYNQLQLNHGLSVECLSALKIHHKDLSCEIQNSTFSLLSKAIDTTFSKEDAADIKSKIISSYIAGIYLPTLNHQRIFGFKMGLFLMRKIEESITKDEFITAIDKQVPFLIKYLNNYDKPFVVPLFDQWQEKGGGYDNLIQLIRLHNVTIKKEWKGPIPDTYLGYLTKFSLNHFFSSSQNDIANIRKKIVLLAIINYLDRFNLSDKDKLIHVVSSLLYFCPKVNYKTFSPVPENKHKLRANLDHLTKVLNSQERNEIMALVNNDFLLMGLLEERTGIGTAYKKITEASKKTCLSQQEYLDKSIRLYQSIMIEMERSFCSLKDIELDNSKYNFIFKYVDGRPVFSEEKNRYLFTEDCEQLILDLETKIKDPSSTVDYIHVGRHGTAKGLIDILEKDPSLIDQVLDFCGDSDLGPGLYTTPSVKMAQLFAINVAQRTNYSDQYKLPVVVDVFLHPDNYDKNGNLKDLTVILETMGGIEGAFVESPIRDFETYIQRLIPAHIQKQSLLVKQLKESGNLWQDLLGINEKILDKIDDDDQKSRLANIFTSKESEFLRQDVIDLVSILRELNFESLAQEIESIHSSNKLVFKVSPLSNFNPKYTVHLQPDYSGG